MLPGGVTSSFQAREPWPVYLARGEGARVWDVDGHEYVDFHNGFSAMVQGHAHPAIGAALAARGPQGTHFAAPGEDAVLVAEELARRWALPQWRFTNSGSEATMGAIRLARALSGREPVLRIAGSYHGHNDTMMAGRSAGIPAAVAGQVHDVEFNDAAALESAIAAHRPACVVMEGAMTGIGVVLPEPGYHEAVRDITRASGVLIVLDEVKTGLTIAAGGAAERFGLEPDLVTLAKALGAGLPSGAIGMSAEAARAGERRRGQAVRHLQRQPAGHGRRAGEPARGAHAARLRAARGARRADGVGLRGDLRGGPARGPGLKGLRAPWPGGRERPRLVCPAPRSRPGRADLALGMNRGLYLTPGREQEWNLTVAHGEAEVDRYLEVFAELQPTMMSGSARA